MASRNYFEIGGGIALIALFLSLFVVAMSITALAVLSLLMAGLLGLELWLTLHPGHKGV